MTYYIQYQSEDDTWARDGRSEDYDSREEAEAAIEEMIAEGDTDGAFGFRVAVGDPL